MSRAAVACAGLAAMVATPMAQQAVFRASVDVVLVDVSVTRGREPVAGLTARDFVLRDNGVVQQLDDVSMGTVPLDVTLVLDLGGSTAGDLDAFKASIERMRRRLRPDDRIRLVAVAGGFWPAAPLQAAAAPLPLDGLTAGGMVTARHMTPLFDGLFYALAWPVPPDRRHLVVAFSDGFDTWSALTADQLRAIAGRADALLHVVVSAPPSVSGALTRQALEQQNRWRLSQGAVFDAVRRTGGGVHRLRDRAAAFAAILDGFRRCYVLRYSPRGVAPDGWHAIEVGVVRRGSFTIRARRGYQGAPPASRPEPHAEADTTGVES